MTQNTSTAVMQRRVEPHSSLDDFPTPPWATRALCEWLMAHGLAARADTVREPAANRGHMARPLGEFFGKVEASDVHDYGAGYPVRDYLEMIPPAPVDWTITNPPVRLAEDFARRAILQFTVRVPLNRGKMEADMNTATAYCWIVWTAGWTGQTEYHWVAPCRKRLERSEDHGRML